MALLRPAPYRLGDVIDFRGPRGEKLHVHAPDGLELQVPAPGGRARLWLAQPGTWRVRWGAAGEITEIEVAESAEQEAPPAPAPPHATYRDREGNRR